MPGSPPLTVGAVLLHHRRLLEEEIMIMLRKILAAAAVAALLPAIAVAQDEAPLKIGVVSFLSGAAAGPFGVPARNAAEITIEMLNAGKVPAPYATKGFGGA